jgi:hypothetical protein
MNYTKSTFHSRLFATLAFAFLFASVSFVHAGNRQVELNWNPCATSDFSHFNVYRSTSSTGPFQKVNASPVTLPSYVDSGLEGGLTFHYRVSAVDLSGNESAQSPAAVAITEIENLPPVANAGTNHQASEGKTVTLDGSASLDPDGSVVAFLWTQSGLPGVELADDSSSVTTFVAPAVNEPTTLTFTLYVWDERGLRSADFDLVDVRVQTLLPAADAGPDQSVFSGVEVSLDGSGSSDAKGSIASHLWLQKEGPAVQLSDDNAAKPSFIAPFVDAPTTLTFELFVWNDRNLRCEQADSVRVLVRDGLPVANSGAAQVASPGQTVTLDGSASTDPDGEIAAYLWLQVQGPTVALTDDNQMVAAFPMPQAPAGTEIVFALYVWDNEGNRCLNPAAARISVDAPLNSAPVADAGSKQVVYRTQNVRLDGTKSNDPDGDTLTYRWTQISGNNVSLSGINTATPTFTAPYAIFFKLKLVFRLTVSDGEYSSISTVEVEVLPKRPVGGTEE